MKQTKLLSAGALPNVRRLLSGWMAVLFFMGAVLIAPPTTVAYATDEDKLKEELSELTDALEESKEDLAALESLVKTEEQKKAYLSAEIETLTLQMDVILSTIALVQEEINKTQLSIQDKIAEIAEKQTEYDAEFEAFGNRLAAMQELNDGGAVAILSAVKNLYQLLTFDQTLQDISDKNAEMLYDLEAQRTALETAKADLETTQETLKTQHEALDVQYANLETTKASINANYLAVSDSIEEAEAAQKELEEKIEADTIRFDEVKSELDSLHSGAEDAYGDLDFTGTFICPLPAGQYRISQYFKPSEHPALDYAAAEGTPIYATASGYVTAAQWNSGGYGYYVLIYHGQCENNTFSSLYAHMVRAPSVSVGQYVEQGQVIGYVGNTGNSFGNHLHYELWANSNINNSVANKAQRVNPLDY